MCKHVQACTSTFVLYELVRAHALYKLLRARTSLYARTSIRVCRLYVRLVQSYNTTRCTYILESPHWWTQILYPYNSSRMFCLSLCLSRVFRLSRIVQHKSCTSFYEAGPVRVLYKACTSLYELVQAACTSCLYKLLVQVLVQGTSTLQGPVSMYLRRTYVRTCTVRVLYGLEHACTSTRFPHIPIFTFS